METVFVVLNGNDEPMGDYETEASAKAAIFESDFHFIPHVLAYPDYYEDYFGFLEELADKFCIEPKDITFNMFLEIAEEAWEDDFFSEDWRIEEVPFGGKLF